MQTMTLNMGPHHPSTHGVLRVVLELDGEKVVRATPDVGYLHTGIEKTCEDKLYLHALTLTDRQDYLGNLIANLGFSLAVERILDVDVPPRAKMARVVLCELQRIASHLVFLGAHGIDLGATTPFLYGLRDRELILDVLERCSGVRMMTSYIRPGGLSKPLPDGFAELVDEVCDRIAARLPDYDELLTHNPIFRNRTLGVGKITAGKALALGVTGPPLRATGCRWDLRRHMPYAGYEEYDFDVPVGQNGDVYDRFVVRRREIDQSLRIVRQGLERLPDGPTLSDDRKIALPPREELDLSMESLIHHFILVSRGFQTPVGEVYAAVESPRGELGFYIVSDGTGKPYRCHFRSPSLVNLQALDTMSRGHMVADMVAIIASLDVIMGDCDR